MQRGILRGRTALSLVEFLIVTAIVVVLVGLMLPAVLKVRLAAARMQSNKHLKQIGVAFHSHHEVHGVLPHGGNNVPGARLASATDSSQWSWAYQILPFIQEGAVHASDVGTVDATPIKPYYIPARRAASLYNGSAKIDYAGNAGTGLDGAIVPGPHSTVRFEDVHDGTSNTVVVGEKQLNPLQFGVASDDDAPYARAGWNGDFEVYRLCTAPPAPDQPDASFTGSHSAFGSPLQGGFSCVFADGSVRHIAYGIDPLTWQRACVRNDSRAVMGNEW